MLTFIHLNLFFRLNGHAWLPIQNISVIAVLLPGLHVCNVQCTVCHVLNSL